MAIAMAIGLALVTVALAVVSGLNDGGVLLALATRYAVIPLRWFLAIVCVALVAGPMLFGVTVADTLVTGLFATDSDAESVFVIGTAVALLVVWQLTRLGLPTSLTLALVGGISGAAAGAGLAADWTAIGRVLLIGLAAPVVSLAVARYAGKFLEAWGYGAKGVRVFRILHVGAFAAQCLAYSVNDGQKMLAIAAVALASVPAAPGILEPANTWWLLLVLAALMPLFAVGMVLSLRRVTRRIGRELAVLRPVDAVAAEAVGAGAVFVSSVLGAPVSMSQSVAAAVVGSASSKGRGRVRWDSAARVGLAWVVTLPASGLPAFAVGWLA